MPATSVNMSGWAPGDRNPHTPPNPSVAELQLVYSSYFQLRWLSVVILFDGGSLFYRNK